MRTLLFLIIVLPCCLRAQVFEQFDDGDFTQNPAWMGDTGHFKISVSSAVPENMRPALQLDAPEAGQSSLVAESGSFSAMEWQFWIKMSMNTSAGNFARIYLCSDQSDLKSPLEGFFIQAGGADDSVSFFRQDSLEMIRLLTLDALFTGNSTNSLRIRITRDAEGLWTFLADAAGGNPADTVGTLTETTVVDGAFFGLFCQYTSSNASKFYFDDLYAGPMIVDTLPPELVAAEVVGRDEIRLIFSEAVAESSASEVLNYELTPGMSHPFEAFRLLEPEQVHLFFEYQMENGASYTLMVRNIRDDAGNIMEEALLSVFYYECRPWEVIFTEIMADPSPIVSLPEAEYVELLNRSGFELNLAGWRFQSGSSVQVLPPVIMPPGSYALLSSVEGAAALVNHGNVTGIPSFSLPNNGTTLRLMDPKGQTICALAYDPSWYCDPAKSEGGWALEMQDTTSPCKDYRNWRASAHPAGGTPGRGNLFPVTGQEEMEIAGIRVADSNLLELIFSQVPDSISASGISHYRFDPPLMQVAQALPGAPESRTVGLVTDMPIPSGMVMEVVVSGDLCNCIAQKSGRELRASFAWPEPCDSAALVINEILFNPLGDGPDYIELHNPLGKTVSLSGLTLASVQETEPNPPDTTKYPLLMDGHFLLPDGYLLLSEDPGRVSQQYFCPYPLHLQRVAQMPAYSNEEGCALLLDGSGSIIDGMKYHEDMHHPLLNSVEGVALERIVPGVSGFDRGNWYSAAETAGFGTPGYRNSQRLEALATGGVFSVSPELFSPDGDGMDDHLGIQYSFDAPGKLMSILVFTSGGRLARNLVNAEFPGTEGIYTWDGLLDDRTPAPDGIYVILAEALGMDGKTHRFRHACVLARRR